MTQNWRYSFLATIPALVIIDQVTKWMVLNTPVFNAMGCLDRTQLCGKIELSPIFDLSMVWNRGVSFGIGQSEGVMRWVLVVATTSIAIGFAVWLWRAQRLLTGFALTLVVAGAIGNVIDRIRFGAVVDFFDFSDIWFVYVFNVADACITVGAVLLFVDQFLMSREASKGASSSDGS